MPEKIKSHITLHPATLRAFRVFCASHGLRHGHGLATLLGVTLTRPLAEIRNAVAACDLEAGEIVPPGTTMGEYAAKALGAAQAEEF